MLSLVVYVGAERETLATESVMTNRRAWKPAIATFHLYSRARGRTSGCGFEAVGRVLDILDIRSRKKREAMVCVLNTSRARRNTEKCGSVLGYVHDEVAVAGICNLQL